MIGNAFQLNSPRLEMCFPKTVYGYRFVQNTGQHYCSVITRRISTDKAGMAEGMFPGINRRTGPSRQLLRTGRTTHRHPLTFDCRDCSPETRLAWVDGCN